MPRRFVLTGAPGSGKTALLHALRDRGWAVVEEAATDVIASLQAGWDEPWRNPEFITRIVGVQRERRRQPVAPDLGVQLFDRSPLCTLALARYLGHPVPPALATEVAASAAVYEQAVLFVRPLGRIEPTAARRITYEQALAFEAVHEQVYREYGYRLVDVAAGGLAERVATVETLVAGSVASGG
jgi:predicted ATPase